MNTPDGGHLAAGLGLVAISLIPAILVPSDAQWWNALPPLIATCAIFIVGWYLVIGAFL